MIQQGYECVRCVWKAVEFAGGFSSVPEKRVGRPRSKCLRFLYLREVVIVLDRADHNPATQQLRTSLCTKYCISTPHEERSQFSAGPLSEEWWIFLSSEHLSGPRTERHITSCFMYIPIPHRNVLLRFPCTPHFFLRLVVFSRAVNRRVVVAQAPSAVRRDAGSQPPPKNKSRYHSDKRSE